MPKNSTGRGGPGTRQRQCAHHRVLAEAGLANMVLFETGVSAPVYCSMRMALPTRMHYFVYQFWPDDIRYTRQVCTDFGTGASFSVYEPGWMKNIIAMARAGTLPRGSKLNLYFRFRKVCCHGPSYPRGARTLPEDDGRVGLEMGGRLPCQGRECHGYAAGPNGAGARGGSLRVGLEDDVTGPGNVEQIERARELVDAVGRRIINGPEAIEYLDIPFPATRP